MMLLCVNCGAPIEAIDREPARTVPEFIPIDLRRRYYRHVKDHTSYCQLAGQFHITYVRPKGW